MSIKGLLHVNMKIKIIFTQITWITCYAFFAIALLVRNFKDFYCVSYIYHVIQVHQNYP